METGVYQGNTEIKANEKGILSRVKNLINKFNPAKASFLLLLFFAARAQFLGAMMPFGAALVAAEYFDRIPLFACVLAIASLALSTSSSVVTLRYAACIALFLITAKRADIGKSPLMKGAVMGTAVFLTGIIQKIFSGIVLYDVAFLTLEGIVTLTAVYLFSRGKSVVFTTQRGDGFTAEDIICASALLGVGIMGLGDFELFGINPAGFLCVLFALILSYENGSVCGAAAGVTIGLIYGFYRDNPVYILSAFALGGALSGFFGKYGRAACALAFILASSLITFYSVSFSSLLLTVAEAAAATIVFVLLPHSFVSRFYIGAEKQRSYADKLRELTYSDLHESAQAISEVSSVFKSICDNRLLGTESAVSSFFERTARKLCASCTRCTMCWRNEFHRTYTAFFVMLELCEKQGGITPDDIPRELCGKCTRRDALCSVFSSMYEVYKVDKLWQSRVCESRLVLAKQLDCISSRIEHTASTVERGVSFDASLEAALSVFLAENAIFTRRIFLVNSSRIEIILRESSVASSAVLDCVSRFTGDSYTLLRRRDNRLTLCKSSRLRVSAVRAQESKNENPYNGDSVDFLYLDDERYLLILSDGMGSGERAGIDSRAAVDVTKKLLCAGFDVESTLAMVNSVLVLKSAETSFATLDVAILDLRRGIVNFCKSGAAASFIRRGNEVYPISSSSLPAGVMGKADIEINSSKIRSGDIIFMVSDGIIGSSDIPQLCSCISSVDVTNPGEAAANLLRSVKHMHADIVSDDMTVLSAFVNESA